MAFDKTTAMRNAERYLAQGKINSAISEYKQVVKNDPKDFGTTNMLGDLYAKTHETTAAVECYTAVAEHYGKQGFAAKAIAVYNKIAKIAPGSPEISKKLAELYVQRGSVNDARHHYKIVAESYEANGKKVDALTVWKQIADLDPNNTETYQTLGQSFLREGQKEEALDAFTSLAERLVKLNRVGESVAAFEQALEIDETNERVLQGYLQSMFATGQASTAAKRLETLVAGDGTNRDLERMLIECYLQSGNAEAAEKAIVKLVEYEPANYHFFLGLVDLHLENNDTASAARVLSMSSQHMLAGGQSDELQRLVNELLKKDPKDIEGLRLLCELCVWQRDEASQVDALKRLAESAREKDLVADERFALVQLKMIVPHVMEYIERLAEIDHEHGFNDDGLNSLQANSGFAEKLFGEVVPTVSAQVVDLDTTTETHGIGAVISNNVAVLNGNAVSVADENASVATENYGAFSIEPENQDDRLKREIDSIKFYIESGYNDLAQKALAELEEDFGSAPEIIELKATLDNGSSVGAEEFATEAFVPETINEASSAVATEPTKSGVLDIDDLRNELGLELEEEAEETGSDYDTHYHTAIAYQEMGLTEEAIKEYQNAVASVSNNDGTRRFFQCAIMLGHCFMSIGKANLALTWYMRTLDTKDLADEEKQGVWYEIANAYEAENDTANAAKYFEMVFAENINFRDVGERLKKMSVDA